MSKLARPITKDEIAAYRIAGVVLLRGILDLGAVNATSGFEQHGILGGDYLSHFLVKIDLRRYSMKLTPQTKVISVADGKQ